MFRCLIAFFAILSAITPRPRVFRRRGPGAGDEEMHPDSFLRKVRRAPSSRRWTLFPNPSARATRYPILAGVSEQACGLSNPLKLVSSPGRDSPPPVLTLLSVFEHGWACTGVRPAGLVAPEGGVGGGPAAVAPPHRGVPPPSEGPPRPARGPPPARASTCSPGGGRKDGCLPRQEGEGGG